MAIDAPTAPDTTTYTDGPGLSMTRYNGPAAAQAPAPAPSLYSAYPQTAASMSAARRSAPMPSMPISPGEAARNEQMVGKDVSEFQRYGPHSTSTSAAATSSLPPMLPGAPLSQAMPTPYGTHFPTDPLARARMGLDTMSPRMQADLSYRMGLTPNPAPASWEPGQTPSWVSAGFNGNNPGPVHRTQPLPYTGAIGPTPSGAALGSPSLGGGYGAALPTAPGGRVTTRTPLPNGGYTTTVTGGGPTPKTPEELDRIRAETKKTEQDTLNAIAATQPGGKDYKGDAGVPKPMTAAQQSANAIKIEDSIQRSLNDYQKTLAGMGMSTDEQKPILEAHEKQLRESWGKIGGQPTPAGGGATSQPAPTTRPAPTTAPASAANRGGIRPPLVNPTAGRGGASPGNLKIAPGPPATMGGPASAPAVHGDTLHVPASAPAYSETMVNPSTGQRIGKNPQTGKWEFIQ